MYQPDAWVENSASGRSCLNCGLNIQSNTIIMYVDVQKLITEVCVTVGSKSRICGVDFSRRVVSCAVLCFELVH